MAWETLDQVRAYFQQDRFAADAGLTIESVAPGRATVTLVTTPAHGNAAGAIMGGVLATMADFGAAVAANADPETGRWVSADAHIHFLRPCFGGTLRAEAQCIQSGRRLTCCEVAIWDEQETLVAKALFTMCRT